MHGTFPYGPFRHLSCRVDALFEYGEGPVPFLVLKVLVVCLLDLLQIVRDCLADHHDAILVMPHAGMTAEPVPT